MHHILHIHRPDHLNAEALKALVRNVTTGTDPQCREDAGILEDVLSSFQAYVDAVVHGETQLLLHGPDPDGTQYREMVSQYDQHRHGCHEAAIINVKLLNRLAAMYGVEPVFTGDCNQRHQVADFCLEITAYFFRNRRMKLS